MENGLTIYMPIHLDFFWFNPDPPKYSPTKLCFALYDNFFINFIYFYLFISNHLQKIIKI